MAVPGFGFYDVGPVRQIAVTLFNGWGYNFYRRENQLRADDQLVRAEAAALLGRAVASVEAAQSAWRRAFATPSRAQPFPPPDAIAGAQNLERLSRALSDLAARIGAQPVPENDRMTERYRKEAITLETLIGCDEQLVGQCELMRSLVDGRDGAAILENLANLEGGVTAIQATLNRRADVLLGRLPR